MNRITGPSRHQRHAFLGALVLLVAATSSVSAADGGPEPLGVSAEADSSTAGVKVGALFGTSGALEGGHFCTASVVHSKRGNLIVTAAHCLGRGAMWFVPGYRDGRAPYGVWKVSKTFVGGSWSGAQNEDGDIAFATLESVKGAQAEDIVGANKFVTGRETGATAVTVTGYPSSQDTPLVCVNTPTVESDKQQRIECPDFTGGTSGSPWVNDDGEVVGVLGGHEQGGSTPDVSYSTVLGDEAAALYRTASGS
ncbi:MULTISPECIES: trypsin-like serine peptidase [Streptomyces]|uniref:trypsin-like serine peptidase n=1 Tax=Streptomyces TaxID=1883 RepID=UPI0013685B3A|nr:trypsin-like peptidase domain-containing protein [Streptomyces sp. SID2888]MYV46920.1 trypsin-like serine protease [Streptomyces sp. SID2888]